MPSETTTEQDLETLLEYIKNSRNVDFTGYKRKSLERRISKRMAEVSVPGFIDYLDYLEVHSEEFTRLFNTILINVTSFFRDESTWKHIEEVIVPEILEKVGPNDEIRIWSAGCSSGEEPYSIAMLFAEALGLEEFSRRVKIYATDLDEEALSKARHAKYSSKEVELIPKHLIDKYMTNNNSSYFFKQELRRALIFGCHNLVQDAPISKLDLLLCRNTLMYMNIETQKRILGKFHFALKDPGYLFLGRAELMLTHTNLFAQADLKNRIFKKSEIDNTRKHVQNLIEPVSMSNNKIGKVLRLRESLFETEKTAILVLDTNCNLLLANEQARKNYGVTNSNLGKPFQDLEVSYNPIELRSVISKCFKEKSIVTLEPKELQMQDGNSHYIEVVVSPLLSEDKIIGASVHFQDVSNSQNLQLELERSNQALETTNEELQSAQEELETTNEELQSTNEELETTNEELQSTNEELETMNEELQSTNEELETMNEELRVITADLNSSNTFLNSIISSIDSAIIVLDANFEILLWNYKAKDLWGLNSDEVKSKSIFQIDFGLPISDIKTQMQSFYLSEEAHEDLLLNGLNRRGRKIECKVRMSLFSEMKEGLVLLIQEVEKK